MAIDTAHKRSSCVNVMLSFGRSLPYVADGSVNDNDRIHTAYIYSGIAIDDPAPPTVQLWTMHLMGFV
jgi:hypothetical protein